MKSKDEKVRAVGRPPPKSVIYICSPLKGDVKRNIEKANYYARYAYSQGCIPLAPHTIFTQFLDDNNPKERNDGMAMGLALLEHCAELWVFGTNITKGMRKEIDYARKQKIEIRWIVLQETEK